MIRNGQRSMGNEVLWWRNGRDYGCHVSFSCINTKFQLTH